MNGYMGQTLYVDLTRGRSRTEDLDADMARQFLGGWDRGTGAPLPETHTALDLEDDTVDKC